MIISGVKPSPHQQQCQSNIIECYKVEYYFDIVAVLATMSNEFFVKFPSFQQIWNKLNLFNLFDFVERIVRLVAFEMIRQYVASTLLLVWTGP